MMRKNVWLLVLIAGIAAAVFVFRKPGAPAPVPLPVGKRVVGGAPTNALPPAPVTPPPPALVSNSVPPAPPPFVPPAVVTSALSNLVDRRLDYVERVRILTSGRLTEVKDPQDLATLATVLADPQEDEVVRHEIVNLLNRSGDPALEARLFQILDNPAEGQKFRAWAVQHLGGLLTSPGHIPVSADLLPRVRQLLTDRDLHVRREALLALSRANDPQALAEIPGLLTNQAPGADGMRDLAIRIAQAQNLRDQIPQIRPYLASTNDTLRVAAIDTLGKWQDQESRPAIEAALKEGSYRVKLCAQQALKTLDAPSPDKP